MASRAGRRGLKSASKIPAVRHLSTSQLSEASNHDRIEARVDIDADASRPTRKGKSEMARSDGVKSGQTPLPLKMFCGSRENNSTDEEFIIFPSYEECPKCDGAEGLCSQNSTLEMELMVWDTVDDTFLHHRPTMHVDYLSHDWLEEDIWASWKYLVSRRKAYSNGPRLENAAWRMWGKTKSNLETVPPESIKWVKDCDVTWLYGPLQAGKSQSLDADSIPGRKVDVEIDSELPKPILKTPSLSELLLQRSLSDVSISRQSSPSIEAPKSDSSASITPRRTLEKANTFPLFSTSSRASSIREKNVRFHDEVAQCVSIDMEGGNELEEDDITCQQSLTGLPSEVNVDSQGLMRKLLQASRQRSETLDALRTIELLPPTRLKAEGKSSDNIVGRANPWPSRTLSYSWNESLLPSPSTLIMPSKEDELDWISPVPREPARSRILDSYLNDTETLTDEELFEIEMFGGVQRPTVDAKVSGTTSGALSDEELEIHSSPSMSEYLSSGSDDFDDDEFIPFNTRSMIEDGTKFHPTSASRLPPPMPQRLSGFQYPNEAKTVEREGISNFRYESFEVRDRDTASPPFRTSPSFAVQQPNASFHSSQFSESMMDDEEHWWMNV